MSMEYQEYINTETIEKFTQEGVCNIKFTSKYVYVMLYPAGMGPCPEFHVDDFTFKGINSYSSQDFSNAWRNFFAKELPKEIRTEYVKTFNQMLDNEKLDVNSLG